MATLRQLKTFVATAEYKNMSQAAKHLYVSQPTISQIISELEKEYDTALFERHAKELHITPAGMLLLENAKQIIAIHETLEQHMKTIKSNRPLRIGATMTVGSNIMGKIIQELEAFRPDIDCFVTVTNTDHIEEMLLHNELDIALVEGIINHEEIITNPAFDDNLCMICGKAHPFSEKGIVTPDELHNQNFILREKGSGTRAIFEQLMRSHHVPYKVKWESNSTPAIIDAVSRNLGLGFVSERCVAEKIENGLIYRCPVQNMNLKRFFYICYHQYHPVTSQMQDFINYINSLPTDFH
ncbi:MAG: LysR family transcriptional regulator [Lachnospiraceae bacterium]|nr:LysR family transcriptional regulator [Lachnospiraceae bacterium]MEE1015063.1 LysR family transcriptional regulator [Lachnospiraceae bacterium]